MTVEFIADLASRALWVTLLVSAPILGLGLVVGVAVSIFQAVTQIQEMTLTFIPKIIAIFIAILVFGKWMMIVLLNFTSNLWVNLPQYVK
ncbi:MAG TPA: flagellar biosynthesis protein FliQ [bacterium]|nr:flagellar biosynthesis protein FliQ [bacterium]